MQNSNSFSQSIFGRYSALAEVMAVFFVGSLLASVLFALAGISGNPLELLIDDNPDLWAISWDTGVLLILQYVGLLSLAALFTWAYRKRIFRDRGFSLGRQSLSVLLGMGIVGWSFGNLPNMVLWILDAEFNLGSSIPWREALLNHDKTPSWWALMAVGSFGLIPILEELFWRGYIQSRLSESFSPIAAMIITSLTFTLSHTQYHQMDGYHLSLLLAIFFDALVIGWIYFKTRSLIPVIVMHALLNFPHEGIWSYLLLAVMLTIVSVKWQLIYDQMREFVSEWKASSFGTNEVLALCISALVMIGLTVMGDIVFIVGCSGFLIALAAVIKFRKSLRRAV